jgi:polysaccharide biosynthesis acetyltransferase WcbI-like protein
VSGAAAAARWRRPWRRRQPRAIVFGNCQADAIAKLLAGSVAFRRRFRLLRFPAVHEIADADVPKLHAALATVDVAFLQPVEEGYRDGIGVGTTTLMAHARNAHVVLFPSIYWTGYMPTVTYLRPPSGLVLDGPFDYHDEIIMQAWADGAQVPEILALLADPDRPSRAPEEAEAAFGRLEERNVGFGVDIVPYLRERYRAELLFYMLNHPSDTLLAYVASELAQTQGVTPRIYLRRRSASLLGHTSYPLHPTDVRALGLRFGDGLQAPTAPYRIRGRTYAPAEAIGRFLEYYDNHRELALGHLGRER